MIFFGKLVAPFPSNLTVLGENVGFVKKKFVNENFFFGSDSISSIYESNWLS